MLKKILLSFLLFFASMFIYALDTIVENEIKSTFYKYEYVIDILSNEEVIVFEDIGTKPSEYSNITFTKVGITVFLKYVINKAFDFGNFKYFVFANGNIQSILYREDLIMILSIENKLDQNAYINKLIGDIYARRQQQKR